MSNKKDSENVNFWLPTIQTNPKADSLTPHKISTIFLIQHHMELKQMTLDEGFVGYSASYRKKFFLLLLKLIQHSDLTYRDFYGLLTCENFGIHPTHLSKFQETIRDMCTNDNGIEAFFEILTMIDNLMSETPCKNGGVCQSGIVGLYIRRAHVTLCKMNFSEKVTLYKSVRKYFERGTRSCALGPTTNFEESELSLVINACKERTSQCKWSIKQAELFVSQQSSLLLTDETEAMAPKELQNKLCEIMQDNPLYSQAYFLCYLNSVRLRDYFNALDALKRSFDRNTLKTLTASTPSENKGYQYSSLNLAILHTQFGHKQEAIQSLQECIMLAQEGGDRTCLDLAQLWLYYLKEGTIQSIDSQSTSKIDAGIATNLSVTIQALVKKSIMNGCQPSKLFDLLLRSDSLNCQHGITRLLATGTAERSALWTIFGKNELASCCSQSLLFWNMKKMGKTYNSDGICEAICTTALWLGLQGEYNLSSVALQHAKDRFPRYPLSQQWVITDCYMISIRSIITMQWQQAEDACNTLYRLEPTLATLQLVNLFIAKRNLLGARELLHELLSKPDLEPFIQVRAKILLANTMFINPTTVLPGVIEVLNSALVLARKLYFSYEVAMIDVQFAYVLLQMQMPKRALKSVKKSIEDILSNGSRYDRARVQYLFTRCLVAASVTKEKKISNLNRCSKILETAVDDFMQLECYTKVKDIYSYLAVTYHDLGLIESRNRFAYKFRVLHEQFPCSKEYFDVFH